MWELADAAMGTALDVGGSIPYDAFADLGGLTMDGFAGGLSGVDYGLGDLGGLSMEGFAGGLSDVDYGLGDLGGLTMDNFAGGGVLDDLGSTGGGVPTDVMNLLKKYGGTAMGLINQGAKLLSAPSSDAQRTGGSPATQPKTKIPTAAANTDDGPAALGHLGEGSADLSSLAALPPALVAALSQATDRPNVASHTQAPGQSHEASATQMGQGGDSAGYNAPANPDFDTSIFGHTPYVPSNNKLEHPPFVPVTRKQVTSIPPEIQEAMRLGVSPSPRAMSMNTGLLASPYFDQILSGKSPRRGTGNPELNAPSEYDDIPQEVLAAMLAKG